MLLFTVETRGWTAKPDQVWLVSLFRGLFPCPIKKLWALQSPAWEHTWVQSPGHNRLRTGPQVHSGGPCITVTQSLGHGSERLVVRGGTPVWNSLQETSLSWPWGRLATQRPNHIRPLRGAQSGPPPGAYRAPGHQSLSCHNTWGVQTTPGSLWTS